MSTMVDILPSNERQARELAKLESPEQRAEVWQEIVNEAEEAELQNRAAESRLRTQRWLGQYIADHFPHGGDRRSSSHHENLKISDLGIDHNQASRWQTAAKLPT